MASKIFKTLYWLGERLVRVLTLLIQGLVFAVVIYICICVAVWLKQFVGQ